VVLDVRLPKRSGYEVCDVLRADPEDPHLPIIMVSAAAETEARLQGLSRGADDYVAKPFSPKELIARIRRLLARSAETRDARRRSREAEHELGQAREEARRSHAELLDQQRLHDLADAYARDFHASLDGDALTRRLLVETQALLGSGMAALLRADESEPTLRASATRGDVSGRASRLRLEPGGELLALLSGLGRPVRRRDLDRFPELRDELQFFIAAGIAVLAPLRSAEGVLGVVVADERFDGRDVEPSQLESVGILCHTASLALRNASRAVLSERMTRSGSGRMARINFDENDRSSVGAAQRYAKNMPIQGTSADILKRALRLLHDGLRDTTAQLVNIVHDEIVIECDAADAEDMAGLLETSMLKAGGEFVNSVPVKIDVNISDEWCKS